MYKLLVTDLANEDLDGIVSHISNVLKNGKASINGDRRFYCVIFL